MAIKIDKVINLTQDSLNTSPKLVKNLQIAMEPDASIFQYYIANNRAGDKESDIVLGSYDDIKWGLPATHLTTQKVKNIGIKSFPQVGAIGFFTFLNEERSKILAPIHVKSKKYTAPSINVIENDTTLTIVISPPIDYGVDESDEVNDIFSDGHEDFDDGDGGTVNEKIKYICHRVILRLEQFALEYVTYENILEVDKPATTGTYDIYCVGYIHEGEAVSEDSNHVYLDITGTREDWPGPVEGSDLYITDVEVTDENKVHIRRSDGFQKDSDNLIPVPISATFLTNNRLQITFNNGQMIVSNNAPSGEGGGGGGTSQKILINSYTHQGLASSGSNLQGTLSNCKKGSDVLLIVVTRFDLTVPADYHLIQRIDPIISSLTKNRQSIYVYKKSIIADADESIEITQSGTNTTFAFLALNVLNLSNIEIGDIVNANIESEEVSEVTIRKTEALAITVVSHQWGFTNNVIKEYDPSDNCLILDTNARIHFVIDNSNFMQHRITLAETKTSSASSFKVWQTAVVNLN